MRSEALDIMIQTRGKAVWLTLAGPFHNEQAPNIKEKILGFLNDGSREIIIDLEAVNSLQDSVVPMFLTTLNLVKGKGGDLKFLFRNATVSAAFSHYRHLFSIFPDETTLRQGHFFSSLRRRSFFLSRKTGVRISRPVAIFLLFVLCGWFLTLGSIILTQNGRIRDQEKRIVELTTDAETARHEVTELEQRIKPLRNLGLLKDSTGR